MSGRLFATFIVWLAFFINMGKFKNWNQILINTHSSPFTSLLSSHQFTYCEIYNLTQPFTQNFPYHLFANHFPFPFLWSYFYSERRQTNHKWLKIGHRRHSWCGSHHGCQRRCGHSKAGCHLDSDFAGDYLGGLSVRALCDRRHQEPRYHPLRQVPRQS